MKMFTARLATRLATIVLSGVLTSVLTVALTSAVLVKPAMAQGYNIQVGDVLKVEVIEDPSLNRSVLVAPDGRISLPLAGSVNAAGRQVEAISAAISGALASNFAARPTVYVSLDRLAERAAAKEAAPEVITIYVLGEAGKPGQIALLPGSTALQAFAQMGGFGKFAATKRIQLRRGTETFLLNYRQIEAGTSTAGSMVLKDGDVIVVPQRRLFE